MNNFEPVLFRLKSYGIKLRINSIKLISLSMVLIPCLVSCDRGEVNKSISESNLPKCSGEVEAAWSNCYGEMKYESGDVYRGEYKDGKYFGKGEFLMSNGDKFLGNWIDGLKNGQGKYSWKDGDVFDGEFKLGLKQGKATYFYFDGRKFIGYYENDKRLNGREYDKDGNLTKEWSHGIMSQVSLNGITQPCSGTDFEKWNDCFGRQINPNKTVYEGAWKNGQYHGEGRFEYTDGASYVGSFENNNFNGKGTFIWSNGDKYVGEFKDDEKHGIGILYINNEPVKNGFWENDKFVGVSQAKKNIELEKNQKNCEMIDGMSVSLAEMISQTFRVSYNSVEFMRGEYGTGPYGSCAVVVDTPVGIKRCSYMWIMDSGNGKPFAATMSGPGVVSCH